jgi:hypothetical protein
MVETCAIVGMIQPRNEPQVIEKESIFERKVLLLGSDQFSILALAGQGHKWSWTRVRRQVERIDYTPRDGVLLSTPDQARVIVRRWPAFAISTWYSLCRFIQPEGRLMP